MNVAALLLLRLLGVCACRLLAYLEDALNPGGSGRNLFFAYNTDLTLSTQVGQS